MTALHQDVLWLQVPVHYVVLVQVLQSQDHFRDVEFSDVLLEVPALDQALRQVPLVAVVDYHVQVVFRLPIFRVMDSF